jgi:hypothetical protein
MDRTGLHQQRIADLERDRSRALLLPDALPSLAEVDAAARVLRRTAFF